MPDFYVTELNLDGSQLFSDSENYLTELSESELSEVSGGGASGIVVSSVLVSLYTVDAARDTLDGTQTSADVNYDSVPDTPTSSADTNAFTGADSYSFGTPGTITSSY